MTYEFDNQSLLFGYNDNTLIGMFVMYEGNKLTKEELFEVFDDQADLIVSVPLKEKILPYVDRDQELTEEVAEKLAEDIMQSVGEVYDRAESNELYEDECQFQVSKILH